MYNREKRNWISMESSIFVFYYYIRTYIVSTYHRHNQRLSVLPEASSFLRATNSMVARSLTSIIDIEPFGIFWIIFPVKMESSMGSEPFSGMLVLRTGPMIRFGFIITTLSSGCSEAYLSADFSMSVLAAGENFFSEIW